MEISLFSYDTLSVALLTLFAYHIGIGIHNIYFHPLSKFPGPPLWAAFRYPFVYYMWLGKLPYRVGELHRSYGGVVRTGPDELSFIDQAAWKDIYSKRESSRPDQWQGKLPGLDAHTLVSAPAAEHSRFRKAFGAFFSEKAVRLQEPLIARYIDSLVAIIRGKQRLEDPPTTRINLAEWINFTTFDIMADLGWGASFDCLAKGKYHPWILVVLWYKGLLLGVTLKLYPILGALMAMITPKSARSGVEMVVETSKANVKNRLSNLDDRSDLISAIANYNKANPAQQITQDEMVTNSSTIIVAGSDPLASIVSGALTYLIRQPRTLNRLESEIRSSFSSDQEITSDSTKLLPYLQAVLLEALRLCTPVPDSMRRVIGRGGAKVAGNDVPGGTVVGVTAYAAFRDPDIFPCPDSFSPQRWLQSDGSASQPYPGFHPFGFGPRSCAGQAIAWAEMRLLLTKLIWNFDIREEEPGSVKAWTSQHIYWTWQRDPLRVLLMPARRW